MKEFLYTVTDPNGIHARPAGKLATFAKQFDSSVHVYYGEKEADAKRLLSIMSLGAVCGGSLRFVIAGKDEESARESLLSFCNEALGEKGERTE